MTSRMILEHLKHIGIIVKDLHETIKLFENIFELRYSIFLHKKVKMATLLKGLLSLQRI